MLSFWLSHVQVALTRPLFHPRGPACQYMSAAIADKHTFAVHTDISHVQRLVWFSYDGTRHMGGIQGDKRGYEYEAIWRDLKGE